MKKDNPIIKKYTKIVQNHLDKFPKDVLDKTNQKSLDEADKEYKEFLSCFKTGLCYICREKLDTFVKNKPCMHWLLKPKGFNKKHFRLIYQEYNYFRIQAFLRWIANTEIIAGNINDLIEEKNPNKIFEYTIKYKNLEWSFSCSDNDLLGHTSSDCGQFPHYHFQMRINKKPFIDYSDFHIPFTEEDLFYLPIFLGKVKKAKYTNNYGAGMQEMIETIEPDTLLNTMIKADNEIDSVYKIQTFIEAEPGKTLSGDELVELYKKSKELNIPVARLVKELKNVGSIRTIISPGPRVPDQAGRRKNRKK
jgi:hypothetical protein